MKQPREEFLFGLALTKPTAERAAFLDRECGGDVTLRSRRAHRTHSVRLEPGLSTEMEVSFTEGKYSSPNRSAKPHKLLS